MATTFIKLTNAVLRRLNEVEIPAADFTNTRGVQSLAKDAVKSAIATINQAEYEWPFNAAVATQVLVPGQSEYLWPQFFKVVDWNSFHVLGNTVIGSSEQSLRYMDRDQWYKRYRDSDRAAGMQGRGQPQFVFGSHGYGFGVTPSPDKAYSVRFSYFVNYVDLKEGTDQPRLPEDFTTVIVDGALYHMYMFKDNPESASVSNQAFMNGLNALQNLYIHKAQYVYDTRVNFGGSPYYRGGRFAR